MGGITTVLVAAGAGSADACGCGEGEYDPCQQYFTAHADLDHDGIGDVVAVDPTQQRLRFYHGMGGGSISGGDTLGRGFSAATAIGLANSSDSSYHGAEVFWTDTQGVMRIERFDAYEAPRHLGTIVVGRGWNAVREWTVGDVTADGRTDIVGVLGSELWLWKGRGAGSFEPGKLVGTGWSEADRLMVEPLQYTPQGAGCTGGHVVDGHLLATFRDGRMMAIQVRGDGRFAPAQPVGYGWAGFQHVVLSDVDTHRGPSGRLDLVAQDAAGAWWSYEGLAPLADGTPQFGRARTISGPHYGARIMAP